jgi:hypothetical protein
MHPLILTAACASVALLTACQSPHTFSKPDASWQTHVGQLKHTSDQRTLVGEVVVQRRGGQDFQLDFLKGGSFPLLSLRQDATTARAEGVLARGRWQGTPDRAPEPLRPWLGLREFFAKNAKPGSLTYSQNGQRFDFQLQN